VTFSAPILTICGFLTAEITFSDSRTWHLFPATILFVGLLLYFIVSDFQISKKFPIGNFSRCLPYCGTLLFVIYTVILIFFWRNRKIYSVGSICEYAVVIALFGKVGLAGRALPKDVSLDVNLAVNKRSESR
jgi:hypothetical protein